MLRLGEKIPYRPTSKLTLNLDTNAFLVKYKELKDDTRWLFTNDKHFLYKGFEEQNHFITRLDRNIFRIDIILRIFPRDKSTPDKEFIKCLSPFTGRQVDYELEVIFDLANKTITPNIDELNSVGLKAIIPKKKIFQGFGELAFGFSDFDLDHIPMMIDTVLEDGKMRFINLTRELLKNKGFEGMNNDLRFMLFAGYAIFEVEDASLLPEKKPKVNFNIFSQKPSLFSYKGGVNLC